MPPCWRSPLSALTVLLSVTAVPAQADLLGPRERLARLVDGGSLVPPPSLPPLPSPSPLPSPPPLPSPSSFPSPAPDATPAPEQPPAGDPGDGAALGRRVLDALAGSSAVTVAAAVDVQGYDAIVRHDAAHALPPASTQKAFVATAALLALGTDTRFRTEAVAAARPVAGRLPGSVWLVASGDPYLTKPGLRAMARDVRAAGITTVAGDVRLDDSRFDQRRSADGWKSSYVPGQSGPLSALAVDRNTWRSDSSYLRDPALPAAVLFRDYLREEGSPSPAPCCATVDRSRRTCWRCACPDR